MAGSPTELWRLSATDAAGRLRNGEISALELVESSLDQVGRHDSDIKAFITLCADRALTEASLADRARKAGEVRGPLHGVPFAVKDVTATAGVRTTFGSKIYAENIPDADELCVQRLREAGAILIGKTNTPEFSFGHRTTNFLHGPTANPFDLAYSTGGSSGGSAAAVAMGMVPFAQGTDFGGSVRTPAAFCGVVGLRPTPGRIPSVPKALAWETLSTQGILARNVDDAALMLATMAGRDDRDPTSAKSRWSMEAGLSAGGPIAFSYDLGIARISRDVRAAFGEAVAKVAAVFPDLDETEPDCGGAQAAFETLRAAMVLHVHRAHFRDFADLLTEPARWNMSRGEGISAEAYLSAETQRSHIYANFIALFSRYRFLLLPSSSVHPFLNTQEEVMSIDGLPLRNVIDYLTITYTVSLVGLPCLSVPCGWTDNGLPVGMQIVGPPYSEAALLDFAGQLQEKCGFHHQWPPLVDLPRSKGDS